MNTEPIRPELREWLMAQQAANLPAVRQEASPVPVSRMFPELAQPVQQLVVVQRFDVKAQRMAALALLMLCGGGGVDLAGHGIQVAGTGLWALAVIFGSVAVARIFAPKHTTGSRTTTIVLGHHNNVR